LGFPDAFIVDGSALAERYQSDIKARSKPRPEKENPGVVIEFPDEKMSLSLIFAHFPVCTLRNACFLLYPVLLSD
jgi:hypothetical protein